MNNRQKLLKQLGFDNPTSPDYHVDLSASKYGYIKTEHSISKSQIHELYQQGCRHVYVDFKNDYHEHLHALMMLLAESAKFHYLSNQSDYQDLSKQYHELIGHPIKKHRKPFKYYFKDTLYCYTLSCLGDNLKCILHTIHILLKHRIKLRVLKPHKMLIDPSTNHVDALHALENVYHDRCTLGKHNRSTNVKAHRVGSKSNGGRPNRLHSNKQKRLEYESIYNDYVTRVNNKNAHPKTYKQDVPYAPAHMVALEHGVARTTVRRIFKSLKNVDFKGKKHLI